jgi:hypothetical protein
MGLYAENVVNLPNGIASLSVHFFKKCRSRKSVHFLMIRIAIQTDPKIGLSLHTFPQISFRVTNNIGSLPR